MITLVGRSDDTMKRRIILILTLGALAGLLVLPLNPVNSLVLRLAFLVCVGGAWLGLTMVFWSSRLIRVVLLALPLLVVGIIYFPSGTLDKEKLRIYYMQRLLSFEGVKYFWGGESRRGIDCSGLPRRALQDALLEYGVRHGNSQAVRSALELWWFDASARALSVGYRGYTTPLGLTGTIREMNFDSLNLGDLAITTDGVHMLVYVGEEKWIQADPGRKAVVTLHARTDRKAWFETPVTTHRWSTL